MVSKKLIAPTLAGTGAAGAAGTMAWTLGLFDGEGLEDVVKEAVTPAKRSEGAANRQKVPIPRKITHVSDAYFIGTGGASTYDRKVIDSKLNLKAELNTGLLTLTVNAEGGEDNSWKCTLKVISIEKISSTGYIFTEFERQRGELENELKDENKKRQFVANCSYTRLDGEKTKGEESTIELETERVNGIWNKFKFKESEGYFKRLWTEDFRGIDRIKKDDEWLLENVNATGWEIKETKEKSEKKVTVTISKSNKNWSCNISGNYTQDPGRKTFKSNKLKEILEFKTYNSYDLEKKKFLIRNCRKNNMAIAGLKIKDAGGNQWDFDETSLKKISEGMYENPTET